LPPPDQWAHYPRLRESQLQAPLPVGATRTPSCQSWDLKRCIHSSVGIYVSSVGEVHVDTCPKTLGVTGVGSRKFSRLTSTPRALSGMGPEPGTPPTHPVSYPSWLYTAAALNYPQVLPRFRLGYSRLHLPIRRQGWYCFHPPAKPILYNSLPPYFFAICRALISCDPATC
jgi:hypothetical protein